MHKRIFLLAALALLPLLSRAQTEPQASQALDKGRFELSLSGIILQHNASFGPSLWAQYALSPRWRVGLQLSYVYSGDQPAFVFNNVIFSGKGRSASYYYLATTNYSWVNNERWRVFTGLSIGGVSSSFRNTDGQTTPTSNTFVAGLHTGAEYRLSRRWFIQAQVNALTASETSVSLPRLGVGASLGVGYRFGR